MIRRRSVATAGRPSVRSVSPMATREGAMVPSKKVSPTINALPGGGAAVQPDNAAAAALRVPHVCDEAEQIVKIRTDRFLAKSFLILPSVRCACAPPKQSFQSGPLSSTSDTLSADRGLLAAESELAKSRGSVWRARHREH